MAQQMSGLVLAGGASRRMGRDKAQIVLDGEPLVVRAVRLLSQVASEVLVASGDGRRLDHLGFPQVRDAVPDAGPLAGIVAGLEAAAHPLVGVLAVDMPDASPAVLALLTTLWRGEAAVVPVVDGRIEPLHAVWSRAAGPALAGFLAEGGRSVTGALDIVGARFVEAGEWAVAHPAGTFASNLNAPRDLAIRGA